MMNRQEAIHNIENLYPPDADNKITRDTGIKLLEQAKREVSSWRTLPTEVLVRFAELCIEKDDTDTRKAMFNRYGL
jgi:hypothetical protein